MPRRAQRWNERADQADHHQDRRADADQLQRQHHVDVRRARSRRPAARTGTAAGSAARPARRRSARPPRRRRTSSPAPRAGTACRIAQRRAPSALRRPISRVRSVTDTNMMFITPTPPIASVSTPMNVSTSLRPSTMPAVIFCDSADPNDAHRAFVGGIEAQPLAEQLLHLRGRPRVERRIHRLIDQHVEVLGVPELPGRRVGDEHALLVRTAVVRELHLLLLHADDLNGMPLMRTSRRRAARCRTASAPPRCRGTPTRRCRRTSSASMKRPAAAGCVPHDAVRRRDGRGRGSRLLRPHTTRHVLHELGAPRLHQRQFARPPRRPRAASGRAGPRARRRPACSSGPGT